MAIAQELLDILVCPESREPLVHGPPDETGGDEFLLCVASKLLYRVDDGIPVMLIDEAQRLEDADVERWLSIAKQRGAKAD